MTPQSKQIIVKLLEEKLKELEVKRKAGQKNIILDDLSDVSQALFEFKNLI